MLPDPLARAVRDADAALAVDPEGSLPLPDRRRVWRAFGPVAQDTAPPHVTAAHRRRVALAALAVQRVLPIWDRERPGDHRVLEMLTVAERYLAGEMDWDATWDVKNLFYGDVEAFFSEGVAHEAAYIGFAAANVVTVALQDQPGASPDDAPPDTTDDELDPYGWDTSYYACLAEVHGSPTAAGTEAERRRAFWSWYLHDAVPQAWSAVDVAPVA